ncbi:MAG TPA: hypothetical protein PK133_04845 [Ferruginibacter sp.]|nr:hypothetical protein [Chitinophagaceae bacterium]MBP6287548.1 hypothetical protein [Ferruginibacter sp.]HQY11513.1 hypothetical protein [Ferruginibacter sp.]
MKLRLLVTSVLVLVLGINIAEAQPGRRMHRHRIGEGIRSGELTRAETRSLALQQRNIRRDIKMARRDGVVTPRERRDIRKDKRMASRSIYRKKHNRRHRI